MRLRGLGRSGVAKGEGWLMAGRDTEKFKMAVGDPADFRALRGLFWSPRAQMLRRRLLARRAAPLGPLALGPFCGCHDAYNESWFRKHGKDAADGG